MRSCALVVVLIAVISCNTKKNYKTLSFFFDGVPAPEVSVPTTVATTLEKEPSTVSLKDPYKSRHKPWEERQCDKCHDRTKASFLQTTPEKLCFVCHDEKLFEGPYVHGPVSIRACLSCHEPHRAKASHLLKSKGSLLCFHCHSETTVYASDSHLEGESCIKCHNPHAADNIFLLKPIAKPDGSSS